MANYDYPYDGIGKDAVPVLNAAFLAKEVGKHHPAPYIGFLIGQNVACIGFTVIMSIADGYDVLRYLLMGLFWALDILITILILPLCKKGNALYDSILEGEYRIVTLTLESLTQEEVKNYGRGSSHVYRDVYHFEGISEPYKQIAKPGRVMLRAAEGDKFHVVFLNTSPNVPYRIYPADSYRLPQ